MEIFITAALFAIGLVLIIKGGDWFVDAATWMAEVSGIPKFIIGATVVSVATTLPELIVSLLASIGGQPEIAVGNAVGSVTANTGLILGISVLCLPSVIERRNFGLKGILMTVACASLLFFSWYGLADDGKYYLYKLGSIILLGIFVVFTALNVIGAKKERSTDTDRPASDKKTVLTNILKFLAGTAGIAIGARLLVDNGSKIALMLGVDEGIVGVTLVAIGTSLPELVTTITAISRKQSSLSVGNIIGANIMDLTMIMPICSLIKGEGVEISRASLMLDMPVCLLIGLLAIVPALISGKLRRWQGALLLVFYAAYIAVLVLTCLHPEFFTFILG